jgi:putative PEP-CTERM system histidine kinase
VAPCALNAEHILFAGASLWALGLACGALARKPRNFAVLSFAIGMALLALDAGFSTAVVAPFSVAAAVPGEAHLDRVLRFEGMRIAVLSALPAAWLAFSLSYSRGNSRKFLAGWKPVLIASCFLPVVALFGCWYGGPPGSLLLTVDPSLADSYAASLDGGSPPPIELRWLARGMHLAVLVSAVLVLMNLERTFRAAVGTLRWRIKFVLLGLGLVFAARVYTSSQGLLYSISDSRLATFNAGALLLGCFLITVSFFRASLSGVEVFPSPAVLEKSLTVLLAGAYLLVVGVFAKVVVFLGGDAAFPLKALVVLLAILGLGLLLASERARFLARRFISRHFHRPFYNYRGLWRSFTERTSSIVDERAYARELANLISDAAQTLSVSVWIQHMGNMSLAASTSLAYAETGSSPPVDIELKGIAEHLAGPPFVLEDSREPWVEPLKELNPDQFQKGGKRVCVPLFGEGQPLGMLIIGDRVNGIPFSIEDFELFKCIGAQAAGGLLNLHLTQQLLQAREMEAFQTMSAFLVHDLKNTASTMSLMLQNLPAHFDDPLFRADALQAISKSVGRINDLINRLTALRQKLELQPAETDLNEVVNRALADFEGQNLVRNLNPVPKIFIDAGEIQKVVVNLLLNAREAAGETGRIQIETGQRNGWAMLSVRDNGCGMSKEFMSRSLFRPFQTTKKKGIGIGMFHSKMIIDAHRGRIEVESETDKGTVFRVLLPFGKDK